MFGSKRLATVSQNAMTPAMLLEVAVSQDADLEKLKELMTLQERWEKNEAKKAYVVAMNNFKANPPEIFKDMQVAYQTSKGTTAYDHASLANVSTVIGNGLADNQLSHRWDVEQLEGGVIIVTCVITHALGHSERVPMRSLADQSGGKNSIQAIGSAITYLERYTLLAATGLATKNAEDDDGASADNSASSDSMQPQSKTSKAAPAASTGPNIKPGPLKVLQAKIESRGVTAEAVCKEFKVSSLPELKMIDINKIMEWIESQ